jgi:subtilase family serine protease
VGPRSVRPTLRRATRILVFVSVLSVAAALAYSGPAMAQPGAPAAQAAAHDSKHDYERACPVTTQRDQVACMVLIRTVARHQAEVSLDPGQGPSGVGYGPSDLQSAYDLPVSTPENAPPTVAVVDAYNDPNAAADLATYRSDWGLPACGSGCFEQVNEEGLPSPLPAAAGSTGWDVEESTDIDMVSAICSLCHIILVEANSPNQVDVGTAVNSAVRLGAKFISNSYGGVETSSDPTYDTDYYKHPGVAIVASAGDDGYGVSYPASSPYVTSVGGTSLSVASNSRGWTETAWGSSAGGAGTGSGCSAYGAKPSWQTDTGCSNRTDNDVAAVADPDTGVAVYDTYSKGGWMETGGTSVSAPIIAAVFALAGNPASGTYPSSYIYSRSSDLYDVTSGADGICGPAYLCTGEAGYDGPTGWGTPDGVAAFTNGNAIAVTNPGNQVSTVGTAVSLQIKATDSAPGQIMYYFATGLPAGLTVSNQTGLISGIPTTTGSSTVTVTGKDNTGVTGSESFTWTVITAGVCTARQLLGNPGFATGQLAPWTGSTSVANADQGVPSYPASDPWLAWLDGYGGPYTDTLAQTVTIPSTCPNATLSFWLDIDSNDPTGTAYDTFTVQVLNSSGTALATLATLSNQNEGTGYVQYSYSVAPYIGQTITIEFTGNETLGGRYVTSFFEDDNALNVS